MDRKQQFHTNTAFQSLLPLLLVSLSACDDYTWTQAGLLVATVVAIGVAVRFPRVCLSYGVLTGLWMALYGPWTILEQANHSVSISPIKLGVDEWVPFLVVNHPTTWFYLVYGWLISKSRSRSWAAMFSILVTVLAAAVGVEFEGTQELLIGEGYVLPGLIAMAGYVGFGLWQATAMLGPLLAAPSPTQPDSPERRESSVHGPARRSSLLAQMLAKQIDWEAISRRAHDGSIDAMLLLGMRAGALADVELAERWMRSAASAGHAYAQVLLGGLLAERGRVDEARPLWQEAVDAGDTDAIGLLGLLEAAGEQAKFTVEYRQVDGLYEARVYCRAGITRA